MNWKEKKILSLDGASTTQVKIRPMGEFSDLEKFVDPSSIIDITNLKEWSEPDSEIIEDSYRDCRKEIKISLLFGSNKPAGTILKKQNYEKNRFKQPGFFQKKNVS